jgi:hypothetical protein
MNRATSQPTPVHPNRRFTPNTETAFGALLLTAMTVGTK